MVASEAAQLQRDPLPNGYDDQQKQFATQWEPMSGMPAAANAGDQWETATAGGKDH